MRDIRWEHYDKDFKTGDNPTERGIVKALGYNPVADDLIETHPEWHDLDQLHVWTLGSPDIWIMIGEWR